MCTIHVDDDTHDTLARLKRKYGVRTYDEVIKHLLGEKKA